MMLNKKQKFKNVSIYIKNHLNAKSKKIQRQLRLGIPSNGFIVALETRLMNKTIRGWGIPNI